MVYAFVMLYYDNKVFVFGNLYCIHLTLKTKLKHTFKQIKNN